MVTSFENDIVAVSMNFYGLQCAILTSIKELEELRVGYNNPNSDFYLKGSDKKKLFRKILKSIRKKDVYYKLHPERMDCKYQAWNDFCNDCIILTALGSAYYGNPIGLIDPQQWESIISDPSLLNNTVSDSTIGSKEDISNILESMGQRLHVVN